MRRTFKRVDFREARFAQTMRAEERNQLQVAKHTSSEKTSLQRSALVLKVVLRPVSKRELHVPLYPPTSLLSELA